MERSESVAAAAIATLCAASVILLSTAAYRLNRHRMRAARRVAHVLGDSPEPESARVDAPRHWRMEARQLRAQLQAHDKALRAPAIALACMCALIGLASLAPLWFLAAVFAALAAYVLGGRARRLDRMEQQALYTMDLLASGLRAGYSVPQAIELVAKHSPEPSASEFKVAAQEIAVGVPLHEAVARLARRNDNKDYELVAIIVRVQNELGGNLAQILDSVGSTLRERLELRRQVNALTAQQRLSSIVLTVLPFALLLFLFVMDRSFVEPMFSATTGRLMLALAGGMVFLGWIIMRSIGRVEV